VRPYSIPLLAVLRRILRRGLVQLRLGQVLLLRLPCLPVIGIAVSSTVLSLDSVSGAARRLRASTFLVQLIAGSGSALSAHCMAPPAPARPQIVMKQPSAQP